MSVSLCAIASNHNEVTIREVVHVFSYETLVGVGTPDGKRYKTDQFHSVTTSKHLNRSGFKDAEEVSPERLACLVYFTSDFTAPQPQKG